MISEVAGSESDVGFIKLICLNNEWGALKQSVQIVATCVFVAIYFNENTLQLLMACYLL